MAIPVPLVARLRLLGGGVLLGGILLTATPGLPVTAQVQGSSAPAIIARGVGSPAVVSEAVAADPSGKAPASDRPLPEAAPGAVPESPSDTTPQVVVEANEPRYVAPTLRDHIGRIWAPVLINGKGPFRLVLDTGASRSAIISRVADSLGIAAQSDPILVRGVTGSAVVPAIQVDRLEVGDLLIEPTTLPIVADVFGGAEGVLGREGMPDKRILADFREDRLIISRSHRESAPPGFSVVPLRLTRAGLLSAEVSVGWVRAQAIIDTGAQQTVGNLALREALMKHPPKDAITEDIIGVTLDLQRGESVVAPPITIGRLRLQRARIAFADMFLFDHLKLNREPTLMLGMDVLGSFDVLVIDYRTREMQIRIRTATLAAESGAEDRGWPQ